MTDKDGDGEADGVIEATGEHPFWTRNHEWVKAKDLRSGDVLQGANGMMPVVVSVDSSPTNTDTFNLTVNGTHTFFAFAGDCPVLVHNAYPFQIGTYGSLNGGLNVGDNLAAHEPLPNAWLQANGFGTGSRLSANPAIALDSLTHQRVTNLQRAWGLQDRAFLKSISAQAALEANLSIMIQAGVPKVSAIQVSVDSLSYAKTLPCP